MANEHLSATSKVKSCKCNHEYQDTKYGKGNRVHNPVAAPPPVGVKYKCTVCGVVRD